ncbi:MAG: YraN family protein [Candidatus Omnitrophica bacterium]|nr:YraN family protein [Candidatus Omnitrophota bacterium]
MSSDNLDLGRQAEESATRFLKSHGYKIVCRNYKIKLGEIDIIAKDKDTFCFVEVKSRRSDKFGLPAEAVSRLKQLQISRVALSFLKTKGMLDSKARFDVVAIDYSNPTEKIDLIKDAFELRGGYAY